jgi:phospholipase/lecithinase/hemolysin
VKNPLSLILTIGLLGIGACSASAAFTNIYVFGDSLSAGSVNAPVGPDYYGDRWSNGRTWVEVLAQRQGINFNLAANTNSEFGNTSDGLAGKIAGYKTPANGSNTLVVVWVNNADLYFPATVAKPTWANDFLPVINRAQTNYFKAITNLYAKGIRTLVLPNVVDISTIPAFNQSPYVSLFHQAVTNYNDKFYETVNRARAACSNNITIYVPDFYTLLNDLLAHPANYGVTNALKNGYSIDALDGLGASASLTNGPGTNYIFWDKQDPTAKVHYIMANVAQECITPTPPALIAQLTVLTGSNRLDMAKLPLGMNGLVEGCTNLLADHWSVAGSFTATNTVQRTYVLSPGVTTNQPNVVPRELTLPEGRIPDVTLLQFYRLRFPLDCWVWP